MAKIKMPSKAELDRQRQAIIQRMSRTLNRFTCDFLRTLDNDLVKLARELTATKHTWTKRAR